MKHKLPVIAFLFLLFSISFFSMKTGHPIAAKTDTTDTTITRNSSYKKEDPYADIRAVYTELYNYLILVNKPWDVQDTAGACRLSLTEMMNAILPTVIAYAASDSEAVFYNNLMQRRYPSFDAYYQSSEGDTSQMTQHVELEYDDQILVVGKFIDHKKTFAIAYDGKSSNVNFYRLVDLKWKKIGNRKLDKYRDLQTIWFEEMNATDGLEIVMATSRNMNNNMWMDLFTYSEKEDKIDYAGNFCTLYHINLEDTTLTEEYSGSWYMDQTKTIYRWKNNKLTPIRKSVMVMPKDWDSTVSVLEYYENPLLKFSEKEEKILKRIFREKFNDTSTKHQKYWDNFFELGKYLH